MYYCLSGVDYYSYERSQSQCAMPLLALQWPTCQSLFEKTAYQEVSPVSDVGQHVQVSWKDSLFVSCATSYISITAAKYKQVYYPPIQAECGNVHAEDEATGNTSLPTTLATDPFATELVQSTASTESSTTTSTELVSAL